MISYLIGRLAQPKEITGIALYLASGNSASMTGNVICIKDGVCAM